MSTDAQGRRESRLIWVPRPLTDDAHASGDVATGLEPPLRSLSDDGQVARPLTDEFGELPVALSECVCDEKGMIPVDGILHSQSYWHHHCNAGHHRSASTASQQQPGSGQYTSSLYKFDPALHPSTKQLVTSSRDLARNITLISVRLPWYSATLDRSST